jgi:predicted RNase H-like HicB family nuclease
MRDVVTYYCKIIGYHIAMNKHQKREYNVIVELDEEGYYVAIVPELPGCHTQARSLDKLMVRIREAIELCIEVQQEAPRVTQCVGLQRILV